jgi:hypothetical protein
MICYTIFANHRNYKMIKMFKYFFLISNRHVIKNVKRTQIHKKYTRATPN